MITVRNQEPAPNQVATPTTPAAPEDILETQARLAKSWGANRVTITGAWIWAKFAGKPTSDVRHQLKDNRWVWCRNKGLWAYRGKPCHSRRNMTWDYITGKYGEREVKEESNLVLGAA